MDNLVVHIVLPKGLRLTNGTVLTREATFSVVSSISPFYCSVSQVRLHGGTYLNKLADTTIADMIYEISKDADSFSFSKPTPPVAGDDPEGLATRKYKLWINARQNWVNMMAARQLILNVWDLAGTRGGKTLGNFSMQHMALVKDEGMQKKLTDMQNEAADWLIVIKSGGDVGPGGHARGRIVAKGMYDPASVPPGRLWMTTGMGANSRTIPGYGSVGSSIKYGSSPIMSWKYGRYVGGFMVPYSSQLTGTIPGVVW